MPRLSQAEELDGLAGWCNLPPFYRRGAEVALTHLQRVTHEKRLFYRGELGRPGGQASYLNELLGRSKPDEMTKGYRCVFKLVTNDVPDSCCCNYPNNRSKITARDEVKIHLDVYCHSHLNSSSKIPIIGSSLLIFDVNPQLDCSVNIVHCVFSFIKQQAGF